METKLQIKICETCKWKKYKYQDSEWCYMFQLMILGCKKWELDNKRRE